MWLECGSDASHSIAPTYRPGTRILQATINGYIAKQLTAAILIVVVSLTCVIWLSQSLRFVDMIVNRGLPLLTFIYLTMLLLPTWLSIVLPIAGFAGVVFIYNRMAGDREIVVLEATGLSPLRLARPAILVSLVLTLLCYLMTLYLIPVSYRAFKELQFKIRHNYTDVLLREGVFNTIGKEITVYVRARESTGQLRGIIVHDDRDAEEKVTLIAERGALVVTKTGPRVFMQNGNRQSHDKKNGRTSLLYFDRYTVDISTSKSAAQRPWRDQNEMFLPELLEPTERETLPRNFNEYIAEGHFRLTSPLLAIALPLIGLAIMLRGDFSRRGQTLRILIAVGIAILVEALGLGTKFLAAKQPWLIGAIYGSVLIPTIVALAMLMHRRVRRGSAEKPSLERVAI
ncbi:MAG: LPS export ABC transporter permease LptF [Rhodospirillaceae bacterium]|nr:LPS export ABC transporter permease LptF [Rhodospirillaceae bacterium]